MRVLELWRYPVKSMQGERLERAEVGAQGLAGDRGHALYDARTGEGLTARRVPELLFASAALGGDGRPVITLPDGSTAAGDDALSAWLGRAVQLRAADDTPDERRFASPVRFEDEDGPWSDYTGAPGAYHDDPDVRVSLVSTGTLGAWDGRRFRSNVLLDGEGEDALVGRAVGVGGAVLSVTMRIARCVLTTRAQPGGIPRDLDVLRTLAREREACLAVGATVARPGTVTVGDELTVA